MTKKLTIPSRSGNKIVDSLSTLTPYQLVCVWRIIYSLTLRPTRGLGCHSSKHIATFVDEAMVV
uniref:Uncharacterized protein n=1 Tax=Rhizophagus irregularis (strain DAOM 181602 / DAOM 197198 / MUCL 43194) TaxID=747089 RepID=U9TV66_RHIID